MARNKRVLIKKKQEKMEAKRQLKASKMKTVKALPQPQKVTLTDIAVERQRVVRGKMLEASANMRNIMSTLDNETKLFLQEQGKTGLQFPNIDYLNDNSFAAAMKSLEEQTKPNFVDKQIYEAKRFLANVAVGNLEEQENDAIKALQGEVYDLIVDATPEQLRKINKAFSYKDLADYYEETEANSSLYEEEEFVARLNEIKRFLS